MLTAPPSVIYVRVSSERQVRDGNGLLSQEQRCRAYSQARGYRVDDVFRDEGVSGALLDRPGIQELLAYLRSHRGAGEVVVVVDDISRIARDVSTHIQLRAAIKACGGRLESPSFKFEENAMGEMVETIFAAVAQYGRTGNREQVINRQRARLEGGFWVFPAPPGYLYVKHPDHKKLLVPDPARAELVRAALEGFATYRFLSKRDIMVFFKENGYYPSVGRAFASKYEMAVGRVLESRWFYAGYIEYRPWAIARRKGRHEPLINAATAYRIEDRLSGRPEQPLARADSDDRLVLRNFVRCAGCGRPLTASVVKGKYPCYHCYNQGNCARYGHRIKERVLHADFGTLLEGLAVRDEEIHVMEEVTTEIWTERLAEWKAGAGNVADRLGDLDDQVGKLARRIGQITDDELVSAYEQEIVRLRKERAALERERHQAGERPPDYTAAFARVGTLLQDPFAAWEMGSGQQKRTVCHMVFAVPPAYDRESGFGTINLTVPYLVSRQLADPNSKMVDLPRETWGLFIDTVLEWSVRLKRLSWDMAGM
ncbi:MAG TPA: recombinase family protein [Armatimonadota bacterium]|jgi:DNA invertase Pin-like site-specific DNA recombinase